MNIVDSTKRYEVWLRAYTNLIEGDLEKKHHKMKEDPFAFLRATFYRWKQIWPTLDPDAAREPVILSVGDLHIDNYGTWRDVEGRLVWGINDFDEADF